MIQRQFISPTVSESVWSECKSARTTGYGAMNDEVLGQVLKSNVHFLTHGQGPFSLDRPTHIPSRLNAPWAVSVTICMVHRENQLFLKSNVTKCKESSAQLYLVLLCQ